MEMGPVQPWTNRRGRFLVPVVWAVSVGLALAVGWWAAGATLEPPNVESAGAQPAVYTVAEGTVGRSLTFTATATWETVPLAAGSASGTVTSVDISAGDVVEAGDRVYSVDERPVTAAAGEVPSYREMSNGMRGADVAQLQRLLASLGHYQGDDTGRFDNAVTRAVAAWQRSIGVPADGIARRGDIVFVPALPARVVPAEGLVIGKQVTPGEDALAALPDAPRFVVPLAQEQRDLVPLTAAVVVEHPGGTWAGRIESAQSGVNGELELVLIGDGDQPICGPDCAEAVPPDGAAHFRTQIVVVPETAGPVVPAAALRTDAAGGVSVTTADGDTIPVTLVAADAGQAVVDGVEVGQSILLFGDAAQSAPGTMPGPEVTDSPTTAPTDGDR